MNRERIDAICERGILALVVAILCFGPLATGAVYPHEFLVVQVLTAGVLLLWLARIWWGSQSRWWWPPVCWPVLAFVAYALSRYFTGDIEYVARWELLRVLVYVALFFAVLNNLHRPESATIIAKSLIGIATLVALVALWQFLSRTDRVPSLGAWLESCLFSHKTWYFTRIYQTRASGTYINPNHLAGLLELLLPLALAFVMVGRGKPVGRILMGYAALMMLAGIGVSVSRGSWISTTLTLLVFFGLLAVQNRQRISSLTLMFVIVMGATFFITKTEFFQQRFRETFKRGVEQDTRYQLWDATVRMWQDHLWMGVGPGHYDYRFRAYRPEEIQLRPDRAHNEFLNLVADWGTLGALLVALCLVCVFWSAWLTWRKVRLPDNTLSDRGSNRFAIFLGTFFGLLAVLAHSAVDFNMQIPANAAAVFCLVALLSVQLRFATDRPWVRCGALLKSLFSLLLVGGSAYFLYQGQRLAREYWWLTRAKAESWHSREEIAAHKRAHAIEPRNFDTTFEIGDAYLTHSKQGGEDNAELATNAITWFETGMRLNRFDQRNYTGSGWCWDWLALRQDELTGLHHKAEQQFYLAETLDPKGYYTLTEVGYHFVQAGDFAAARRWFERSLRLQRKQNSTAEFWYHFSNRKLADAATNQFPSLLR
jgi:O-antigen ligase